MQLEESKGEMASLNRLSSEDKKLYKNFIGVLTIKGFALIVSLLTTSFYIKFFKNDGVLGVWYTIISILQWVLTFDVGIGNGLRNKIASNINDKTAVKKYISSGYLSIFVISLFLTIVGVLVFSLLDVNKVFNVSPDVLESNVLLLVVLTTFIGITLQFVLKLVTSILYALQKNVIANLTLLVTNCLVLIFLIIGSFFEMSVVNKIILLAIVYSIAMIVPLAVQTIFVFLKDLKGCAPSLKFFSLTTSKEILSLGGLFFIVQLGSLFLVSTNSWFISHYYASSDVVVYQNYYKIYSLVSVFFSLLSQPLWSGFSAALKSNDCMWIKKKNQMIYLFALVASLGAATLTAVLPLVFKVWIGDSYTVNWNIAILFCILTIEHIFMYATTCLANAMSKLIPQLIFAISVFLFKVPLILLFNQLINNWVSIVASECVCMIVIIAIQPIANYCNLKKLDLVREPCENPIEIQETREK